MNFTAQDVKTLRERTGAGMMDCKNALVECEGDMEKAVDYLREKGIAKAAKKAGRIAAEGIVDSYIHMGGKIGVLVECKNGVSDDTIHDVALQIAAAKPSYVKAEEVPADIIEKEKEILRAQIANDEKLANKPEMVKEKMVEGKVKKYYDENCVLNQAFIKDPSLTVAQLLAKENSTVIRFTRFEMGEGLEKKSNDFAAEVAAQMKK